MSTHLHVTSPETPLEEAAGMMRDEKIGALPVLRGNALVGLITESDIFRALVSTLEMPEGGVRVTFDISNGEDILNLVSRIAQKRGVRVASVMTFVNGDRPACVARIAGTNVEKFLEDIWASKHAVMNVLRLKPLSPRNS